MAVDEAVESGGVSDSENMDDAAGSQAGGAPVGDPQLGLGHPGALVLWKPIAVDNVDFGMLWHSYCTVDDECLAANPMRVASHMLGEKLHVGSAALESSVLGVSKASFRRNRALSSSLALELERDTWRRVEEGVLTRAKHSDKRVKLLSSIEVLMYDGVDFTIQSKVKRETGKPVGLAIEDQIDSGGEGVAEENPSVAVVAEEFEKGVAKILNAEASIAMLLEVDGHPCILTWDCLTFLQSVDRYTAEALLPAVLNLTGTSSVADEFPRRLRLVMSDGASYFARMERNILRTHRLGWSSLHLRCNIHVLAGIHGKTFDLLCPTLRGLIAFSLSLQPTGQISLFRASLRRVLAQKIKFVRCPPSVSALKYQELMLYTFLGRSLDVGPKGLLLQRFFQG